jgi:hypothetical protein
MKSTTIALQMSLQYSLIFSLWAFFSAVTTIPVMPYLAAFAFTERTLT